MAKDIKREKTLEEIRKKIGLQLQDRRNFLNILLNIKNQEKVIEIKKKHIEHMKLQLNSKITERDRFGNVMDEELLGRDIAIMESQLPQYELQLDYLKEDLYYCLHVNEGVLAKAGGNLEDVKEKIDAHFLMIREEFEKIKKVMENAI